MSPRTSIRGLVRPLVGRSETLLSKSMKNGLLRILKDSAGPGRKRDVEEGGTRRKEGRGGKRNEEERGMRRKEGRGGKRDDERGTRRKERQATRRVKKMKKFKKK